MITQRFTVHCDRCHAELLPIRGTTFASDEDAQAAMANSGWVETASGHVDCYGCADLVDEGDEDLADDEADDELQLQGVDGP